jgi:hypothetical protein
MDIANILTYLRPGETWSLNGDSYDGLVWLSDTKKPTLQEIEDYYSTHVTLRDEKVRITELKNLLSSSDWRMTIDKYESMTSQDQTLWKNNRAAWRAEINGIES